MNTLFFFAGAGAGSFATMLALCWAVGRVNKQSSDRAQKAQERLDALLSERNELDKKKVSHLEAIHDRIAGIETVVGMK